MCAAIYSQRDEEQSESPPCQWFDLATERIPHHCEKPDAVIEPNHTVRPGYLPAHIFVAYELSKDHRIDCVLPRGLNLIQGIHRPFAEQKERALWQLMAEKRVDKINCFSRASPTDLHKDRCEKRSEYP